MIPGMNPKDVAKAMKRLGIKQESIEATQVIIKTPERDLIIDNPQVAKVNMMGQDTWQITGSATEKVREIEIKEEDIKTVMEQAGVDRDKALETIKKNSGDLAAAILELKE